MLTKKQKILYSILCIILLIIGICIGLFLNIENSKTDKDINNPIKENDKEEKPQKKLYYTENGRNIYLYGINRVTVNKQSLSIQNNIFEIIGNLTKEYKLIKSYDEGSQLYQTNTNNSTYDKFNMLLCNTKDGNKDVYFGNTNMEYEKDFCQTNNNKTFIKTYYILNILDCNSDEEKLLVLAQYGQPENVSIVKVSSYLLTEIKEDDCGEFTFKYTDKLIKKDDTESLFENTELIKIEKTDRQGFDQVNDNIKTEYLEKE